MNTDSKEIFIKLKKEVAKTFLQNNSANKEDISLWKGQDILNFQDDLFKKTKNTLSEKSFYTYFKTELTKLPRIDMLNILSEYAGYQNWSDFQEKNVPVTTKKSATNKKRLWLYITAGVITTLIIVLSFILLPKENEFQFCFVDDNTNQYIETPIEIIILRSKESPFYTSTDENGCFKWKTTDDYIKAVIKSPYHKTDTINRSINDKGKESIKLITDDYALMIHFYSSSNVTDWKRRRAHLKNIIEDKAVIYQVFDNNLGIEIYTKTDFINKLTLPTKSLKNIDIIETKYNANNKISSLKFKTNPKK